MTLDHITIRTTDLKETKDFFLKVFDLEEKPRPKAIERIPGHWLFHNDAPLIHLIGSRGSGQDRGAEAFDHVGIKLEGYSDFKRKLEGLKVPYSLMDLPELNERRIFFRTPRGPLLEAVFNEKVL